MKLMKLRLKFVVFQVIVFFPAFLVIMQAEIWLKGNLSSVPLMLLILCLSPFIFFLFSLFDDEETIQWNIVDIQQIFFSDVKTLGS